MSNSILMLMALVLYAASVWSIKNDGRPQPVTAIACAVFSWS